MPMQDNINEIYRMQREAYDRERLELEVKIKDCNRTIIATGKSLSKDYLQRSELLKQYREKYGKEAEELLRNQLDEAYKICVKQYEAKERMESQNGQINEIMDIKRRILDELYKFPTVELLGVLLELQKEHKKD